MKSNKINGLKLGRFLFCLLAMLSLVIGPQPVHAGKKSSKKIYKKALKKWTDSKTEYQREDFYVSIKWTATFQTPEFVAAKSQRISDFYKYDHKKTSEVFAAEQKKFGAYTSFYVSFYSYQFRYADLSKKPNGWKLFLEVDGQRSEPLKFEQFNKVRPLYQVLYPYHDVWSRHYYVYFPKVETQGAKVRLIVAGPLGNSELVWEN